MNVNAQQNNTLEDDEDIFVLDPFEVTEVQDDSYRMMESNTATGIAASLDEIPLNISILNEKRLVESGADTFDRIMSKSPGVATQTLFSNEIVVRGFASNAYLNGNQFATTSWAGKETAFIERVEIVKGPNAVFYGLIQPGGVVNTITKRPLTTNEGSLSIAVGSHNYTSTALDINRVFADGKVRVRFFGTYSDEDFFAESTWKWNKGFGTAIRVQLFEGMHVDTTILYNDTVRKYFHTAPRSLKAFREQDEINNLRQWRSANGVSALYDTYVVDEIYPELGVKGNSQGDGMGIYASEDLTVSGNIVNNLGPYFTNKFNYYFETHQGKELSAGNEPNLDGTWTASAGWTIWEPEGYGFKDELAFIYENDSFTEKLLLGAQMTFSSRRVWWAGAPATTVDVLNGERFTFENSGLPTGDWQDRGNLSEATVVGIYAVNILGLFDEKLHILTGIRQTDVETDAGNYYKKDDRKAFTRERTAGEPTFQTGAVWEFLPGVNLFASYSETFQPQTNAVSLDGVIAGPAIGSGFEGGFKFSDNQKFTGTVSVYQIEVSGIAIRDIVEEADRQLKGIVPSGPLFVQAGVQRVSGAEVEIFYTPTKELSFTFGYSHIWEAATVEDTANPHTIGLRRFNTPRNAFVFTPRYEFTEGKLEGLYIGGTVEYKGDHQSHPNNIIVPLINPDFTVLDLFAGYTTEISGHETTFRLNINNLFDREYTNGRNSYANLREIRLSAQIRF
ncbi:MAG: TonB-dependent receptor [Opitutales bacterium]|nr:TonB-dependent receptor [Opitutales bacterium]